MIKLFYSSSEVVTNDIVDSIDSDRIGLICMKFPILHWLRNSRSRLILIKGIFCFFKV